MGFKSRISEIDNKKGSCNVLKPSFKDGELLIS